MEAKTFVTVAGASVATMLIVNTIQQATGWNARWFPLVVAVAIAGVGQFRHGTGNVLDKAVQTLMVGCLVFATSFAAQNTLVAEGPEAEPTAARGPLYMPSAVEEIPTVTMELPEVPVGPTAPTTSTESPPAEVPPVSGPEQRTFRSGW